MTSEIPNKSALANLKAQLAKMTQKQSEGLLTSDQEALMLSQPVHPGGVVALAATYAVGAIKNVDWDPEDHPRDPNTGQFMKTLGGYIFGKAKKANFKFGSKDLHLDLVPGAVAFQTPGNNVVVSNPDGSYDLHPWMSTGYGKAQSIPGGSHSVIADKASSGIYKKIAENPGVKVAATDISEAKQKLEHPEEFTASAKSAQVPPTTTFGALTPVPALKAGKSVHTAKQYADYQAENAGKPLFTTSDGSVVNSGSWIDVGGKPYLVHASPVNLGHVSVYRWVATKQQASNLVKEDFLSATDLYSAKPIEDPTGKPYGVSAIPADAPEAKKAKPAAGALMTQAVIGSVPNTATAHKNFGLQNLGKAITDDEGNDQFATTVNGMEPLKGGDWVELEGKPYRVLHSPNAGNLALAKWVGSKKQASNNTYDFPLSILSAATKIEDPTGSEYVSLETKIKEILPEPATEEETAPYSTDELVQMYEEGHLSKWELELLGQNPEGIYAGAGDALAKIDVLDKEKALKEYQEDFAKKGVFQIHYTNKTAYSEALSKAPTGTVLTVPDEGIDFDIPSILVKAEDGSWTAKWIGGLSTYESVPPDPKKGYVQVYHPDSVSAGDVLSAPYLQPVEKKVKTPTGVFYSHAGVWYESTKYKAATSNDVLAIGGKLKEIEDAQKFILSAPKGAYVKRVSSTGMVVKINAKGNGKFDVTIPTGTVVQEDALGEELSDTYFNSPTASYYEWLTYDAPKPEVVADSKALDEEEWKSNVFVHPLSGEKFELQPGDKVWKHKTTSNGYIIEQAEGDKPIHFFNSNGKKYLPKAFHKGMKENYEVESIFPGKVEKSAPPQPATEALIDSATTGDVVEMSEDGEVFFTWTKSDFTSLGMGGYWDLSADGGKTTSLVFQDSLKQILATSQATYTYYHGGKAQESMLKPEDSLPTDPIEMVEKAEIGDYLSTFSPDQVWTKVEDNLWKSNSGGKASNGVVHGYVKDASHEYGTGWTFSKADKSSDSPWGAPKAEPGEDPKPIPLTPNAALKKEAVAKKKPVKKVQVQKANKFQIDGGAELSVPPGAWLAQVGEDGEFVLSTGNKGVNDIKYMTYSADGSILHKTPGAFLAEHLKATPAATKSGLKKAGLLLVDNPVDVLDFSDEIAQYETVGIDSMTSFEEEIIGSAFKGTGWENGSYWSPGLTAYSTHSLFPGDIFSNVSTEGRLQGFINTKGQVGKGIASITKAIEADGFGEGELKRAKKTLKALTTLYRGLNLAEELNNPDTTWDDARFEQEFKAVADFFEYKSATQVFGNSQSLKTNFDHSNFVGLLRKKQQENTFKKSVSGLGFDPYNATTAEYNTFAQSKGFKALPALSLDMQQKWVLNELGDPTLTNKAKSQLEMQVQKAVTQLEVATAAANLKKGNTPEDGGPSGIATTQALAEWYKFQDSHWENTGPNSWADSNGDPLVEVSDSLMAFIVNNALEQGAVESSPNPAYGPGHGVKAFQKLQEKYGFSINSETLYAPDSDDEGNLALMKAVAGEGGPSKAVTGMAYVVWLAAHANGDVIGKYHAETQFWYGGSHPDEETHLGSPKVNPGAYKALAESLPDEYFADPYALSLQMSQKYYGSEDDYGLPAKPVKTDWWFGWSGIHPADVLKEYADGGPLSGDKPVAVKPVDVPDDIWDIVSNSTSAEDIAGILSTVPTETLSEAALDSKIVNTYPAPDYGINALNITTIPTHLKQLLYWARANDAVSAEPYFSAVAAKVKSGEFFEDDTPVWLAPDGTKYPLSPGSSVLKASGTTSFVILSPDKKSGYAVTIDTKPQKLSNYSIQSVLSQNSSYEEIFTMPGLVTWQAALLENPSLSKSFWEESELVEAGKSHNFKHHEVGGVLTASLKNSAVLEKDYPYLYAKRLSLPENVRQAILAALESDSKGMLEVLEYKASKGHFAATQTKGLFDASQPWAAHLGMGQVTEQQIAQHWSPQTVQAYEKFFGVSGNIANHLQGLLSPAEEDAPAKTLPAVDDLKLTWAKSKSKGMHSGEIWADQDGNEWMSKAFPNDPNAKARIDAETQANLIGTLFGFGAPTVHTTNLKPLSGNHPNAKNYAYSYLQHMKPAKGDLSSKGPKDLTVKQLGQAMSEHVVDWITSNHDSHSQNLMIDMNGNVFGIDKGQAWKFFPNDKLAVGYLPPGNGAAVWYDQFYGMVQNGSIPKETVDAVAKTVLRKAKKVSLDLDEEYRTLLDAAFQNRNFWPEEYPNKDAYITALVDRKHNTFDDFAKFYKDLYAKSPYEFTIDLDNLTPPKVGEAHVAASQDFADEVSKTSVHGKSIFFSTEDLVDQHVMVSTAKSKKGNTTLTGQAMITQTGDAKFVSWLKKQTIVDNSNSHVSMGNSYINNIFMPAQDSQHPSYLPDNSVFFAAMVKASKTVSSHNASGNTDYNQETLSSAETVFNTMQSKKGDIEAWQKAEPGKPHPNFQTLEAQKSYLDMIETYSGYWQKVLDHKGTANKIAPHFQAHVYQPSKEALAALKQDFSEYTKEKPKAHSEAPVGAKIFYVKEPNNAAYTWTKTGEDTWTSGNGQTHTGPVNGWGHDLWGYEAPENLPAPPEKVEVSNKMKLGNKEVTITLRGSALPNAHYDFESGILNLTGTEQSQSADITQSGNMYEIDFGGTRVFYRPWTGHGVNAAQRGLLRFDHDNWDGDPAPMEEIFSVLRHAGLDLDPATEESMELYYWKHLSDILDDRKDTSTGKWAPIRSSVLKSALAGSKTDAQRLEIYKAEWAKVIGEDKVAKADWAPKFSRQNIHAQDDNGDVITTGHPYWHRPDVSLADIKALGFTVPASSLTYGGKAEDALPVALSGSMLSSEERARYYGTLAKGGASSGSDQNKGSSGTVFTRPNKGNGSDIHVLYHPRVLLRTQNYQFDSDFYGDVGAKKNHSSWDPKQAFQGVEMMIYHAASVMDDIVSLQFPNDTLRQKAIKAYKDRGITHLHGYPIEEIFVLSTNSTVLNDVWKKAIAEETTNA